MIAIPIAAAVLLLLWLYGKTEHGQRADERFRQWEIEDEVHRHEARMDELRRQR